MSNPEQNLTLPVNEIFETIQGEAKFTGTPAIFIRLQGCPVGCGWCDTKHTWDMLAKDKVETARILLKKEDSPTFAMMSALTLHASIKHYDAKHVVITGGEPCLYDLRALTEWLHSKGYQVQVETSGTQPIRVDDKTWVTVSPKINMAGGYHVLPECLERADEIKHPVGKMKDIEQLQSLIKDVSLKGSAKIWLQPLSQSEKATELCVESAIKYGYKVSIQTHKYMNVR